VFLYFVMLNAVHGRDFNSGATAHTCRRSAHFRAFGRDLNWEARSRLSLSKHVAKRSRLLKESHQPVSSTGEVDGVRRVSRRLTLLLTVTSMLA